MRTPITIVFAACAVSAALADDGQPGRISAHPELRALLATDYQFAPKRKIRPVPAPVWSAHATMADMPPPAIEGPEVVKMPAMIVHGDSVVRALDSEVQSQAARAEVRKCYARFGVAVHQWRLKKVTFSTLTELGIPVAVGISW